MKRKLLILCIIILNFCLDLNAQAPKKFSYQSVIRNSSGQLITNSNISLRISILQNSLSGANIYSENHSVNTNINGLATLEIGNGNIITGTFNNINWSTGIYFIKTEVDVTGGNNFNITGTSQLLSVPYALYAENSKQQGKTSIYITGDITDSQANLQIQKELGVNTENIYIINTTVLTSLNLSSIDKLVTIEVTNNSSLTNLNFSGLSTIYKKTNISSNPNLLSLNFTSLSTFFDDFEISSNPLLNLISLANLNKIYATYFIISNNLSLTTISAPSLISAKLIQFNNNQNLVNVSLSSLTNCGSILLGQSKVSSFSVPTLISGSLSIANNSLLTSVNFPNLVTSTDGMFILNNNSLSSINIASFQNFIGFSNVSFNNNALPSNQVNLLLNKMLSVIPLNAKNIKLQGQIPPAPPTGAGIIAKSTLISQGNTVITD